MKIQPMISKMHSLYSQEHNNRTHPKAKIGKQ